MCAQTNHNYEWRGNAPTGAPAALSPLVKWALLMSWSAGLWSGCVSWSPRPTISQEPWGEVDGRPVTLYTLRNRCGMEARILNYGGIVVSLKVPDREGRSDDVVLGYTNLASYVADQLYFGSLVGRYANRIANGRFTLDGVTYQLATNEPPHHLHGGVKGFNKAIWEASPRLGPDGPRLELRHVSPEGDEGYPGTLTVRAVYTVTRDNALRLELTAITDRPTVVNLTHHSYFNLAGRGDILGHVVYLQSSRFLPVDATRIPLGELRAVDGTPFDFRVPTAIGARIDTDDEQLRIGRGYGHHFVADKPYGQLGLHARVYEPISGRILEVFSNQPGMQFYTGNALDGSVTGKYGWTYQRRAAFCLEPHHFPNSVNEPSFPSTGLRPGQVYRNISIYRFGTDRACGLISGTANRH